MSSAFGQYLKLSIFGQSHGEALGVTLDDFPAGMTIDMEQLLAEMARRAPGQSLMTTARKEPDAPEFLSGVLNGRTTGQPICAIIRNTNQRSKDYGDGVDLVRPGHADYTGHVRYFGFEDWRGGGSFSGRLTAGIVLAGALCSQYLAHRGVKIACHIQQLGDVRDASFLAADAAADYAFLKGMHLPVLTAGLNQQMEEAVLAARDKQDSVGGVLECMVTGLPAGLGAHAGESSERPVPHGKRRSYDGKQPFRRHQRRHHERNAGDFPLRRAPNPLHRSETADGVPAHGRKRGLGDSRAA